MRIPRLPIAIALTLGLTASYAQQAGQKKDSTAKPATSGARELFYLAVAPKEKLPPITRASAHPPKPQPGSPPATAQDPAPPPAVHLGIRYNLLVVDANNHGTTVDADHMFRKGDQVALEIESNHSGYLYVLARQSSGQWLPLLPSPEMADQSNVIDPGKRIRVPQNYTFEIQDPPGSEHLVLVFSRDPQDFYELYQSIKKQQSDPPPPVRQPAGGVQVADAGVNKAVADMEQKFGTRDLVIRKVNQPLGSGEPAGSVYVVNGSNTPTSSMTTEIEIRH